MARFVVFVGSELQPVGARNQPNQFFRSCFNVILNLTFQVRFVFYFLTQVDDLRLALVDVGNNLPVFFSSGWQQNFSIQKIRPFFSFHI